LQGFAKFSDMLAVDLSDGHVTVELGEAVYSVGELTERVFRSVPALLPPLRRSGRRAR
jgi:hypothetical protein